MSSFSENLKMLRTEKGISRKDLGKILNVSERLISYWENAERECNFITLVNIADYFGVSLDFLLGRTDC